MKFSCWRKKELDRPCAFLLNTLDFSADLSIISFPPFQVPIQDTPHCCFSLLPSKSCSAMICTVCSPSLSWQCSSPSFGPSWPLFPINGCSALCCSLHSLVGWVSVSYQWEHFCTGHDRWELLSALSSLRAAPEITANVWVVLTAKVLTMGEHSSPSYYRMSNRDIWLSEQCSVPYVNTL